MANNHIINRNVRRYIYSDIRMKKETLEEVANEYSKKKYSIDYGYCEEDYYISFLSFRDGAKWQQERSYSKKEVLAMLLIKHDGLSPDYVLEQFKKK